MIATAKGSKTCANLGLVMMIKEVVEEEFYERIKNHFAKQGGNTIVEVDTAFEALAMLGQGRDKYGAAVIGRSRYTPIAALNALLPKFGTVLIVEELNSPDEMPVIGSMKLAQSDERPKVARSFSKIDAILRLAGTGQHDYGAVVIHGLWYTPNHAISIMLDD